MNNLLVEYILYELFGWWSEFSFYSNISIWFIHYKQSYNTYSIIAHCSFIPPTITSSPPPPYVFEKSSIFEMYKVSHLLKETVSFSPPTGKYMIGNSDCSAKTSIAAVTSCTKNGTNVVSFALPGCHYVHPLFFSKWNSIGLLEKKKRLSSPIEPQVISENCEDDAVRSNGQYLIEI